MVPLVFEFTVEGGVEGVASARADGTVRREARVWRLSFIATILMVLMLVKDIGGGV